MITSRLTRATRLALGSALMSTALLTGAPLLLNLAAVSAARATTPSKLGDLLPFPTIARETAALANKGELAAAKARIKDLETSWDKAEAGLKPPAAADRQVVDTAIDRALSSQCEKTPDAAARQALADLLAAFDKAAGTP